MDLTQFDVRMGVYNELVSMAWRCITAFLALDKFWTAFESSACLLVKKEHCF